MLNLMIGGRLERQDIQNIFTDIIGGMDYKASYGEAPQEVMLLTGSEFFFRSNDTIGFCLMSYYDGRETIIDFGRIGGGSGLLNIRWGAGNKVEGKIMEGLKELADKSGFLITDRESGNSV